MTDNLTITEYPAMIREVAYPTGDVDAPEQAIQEDNKLVSEGWKRPEEAIMTRDGWINRYVKQLEPAK